MTTVLDTETLQAYQALCSFCGWALFEDLTPELVAGFAEQADLFAEAPFSTVAPEESATIASVFTKAAEDKESFELLRQDRSYLFYMTGVSHTSPYESVYRTDDETVFGPTTLEVRAAYKVRNLEFPLAASQPDDHLGLEFMFLAHLLGLASQGDETALEDARSFLSDHTLVFASAYLSKVEQQAESAYYRAVAGLCQKTLDALSADLGAIPSAAPYSRG